MEPLILAVDDCQDERLLVSLLLNSIGCQYITAPDGETALELAQEYHPDLILLDICMPEMDGLAVLRLLKQNVATLPIPVVAVTSIDADYFYETFLAAGGADYLAKPYTPEKLDRIIRIYSSQQINPSISPSLSHSTE